MAISGIGVIKNINNNKEFVFKSYDLEKQWEIYQKQLNLEIHHNKQLQKDWNEMGSSNFDFLILEEIDDDFIMLEEFEDYILTSDNYNSFEISEFYFEYSSDDVISLLYQIIGMDACSVNFKETLEFNGLSVDYYDKIKKEMILLINKGIITTENLNDKLNEFVFEKSQEHRILALDLQEKLLNELHDFVGIGELNKEFVLFLKENNLSEEIGYNIRENIEELIFLNNVFEDDISKQMEKCISKYHEKVSQENKKKLLFKVDSLENDEMFLNKISNLNFASENILNIKEQLKEFISSDIVFEENFDEKLDQLIDSEVEKIWLENKNKLVNYLNEVLGADNVNSKLKERLESNYLDLSLVSKFRDLILNEINKKAITNTDEIDLKLNQLINEEISSINQLKDNLLIFLEEQYGVKELSRSFKSKLNNVQLSVNDGKEFIEVIYNEISSFTIKSQKAISIRVDELIFERNKIILVNQLENLVGKDKNDDLFSTKLKLNYLTDNDGHEIKNELLNLIDDATEIQEVIDLRNSLELKLDEMISKRRQHNYNKLMNITNELIHSIEKIIGFKEINESFKSKLYSNNLGEKYGFLIKNELMDYIKKEDPNHDYESKMNQLKDLKTKTVELVIDESLEEKSVKRNEEYVLLKKQLLSQLYELIGANENTDYFNELLLEYNLDKNTAFAIRDEFKDIIESDEVYNQDKFNYKYEELMFVKSETINAILLDLVKNQKNIYEKKLSDMRNFLLDQLYEIIGKDEVTESFRKRLYSNELSLDYAHVFKEEIKEFICSDVFNDDKFYSKLNELIDLKDKGIDSKIQELIDRESKIKYEELTSLKKDLTKELDKLTDSKNYTNLLKSNYLSISIGNKIKKDIYSIINSNSVVNSEFNYKTEELMNLKETGIENKIEQFIKKYRKIYDENLLRVRENLKEHVYKIIGKDNVNIEFKNKLKNNYLSERFAEDIKKEIFDFIDSDDVYDDKFEVKLDELASLKYEDIDYKIDGIIKREFNSRQEQLKQIRNELNDNLSELIGLKNNNDHFNNLLKSNNLNSKTGNDIRSELSDLINSEEAINKSYEFKLDELNALKEQGIENKLNELISNQRNIYNAKFVKIRAKLTDDLNKIVESQEFKNKLHDNQLHYILKNKFKKEISNLINSKEVSNPKFEVKLDELLDLNEYGIESKLNDLIETESKINSRQLSNIKKELRTSLDELIGLKNNTEYYDDLLKSNNLNSQTAKSIRMELVELISSKKPVDNSYEFKLDELLALKDIGLKNYLKKVIDRESEEYLKNLKLVREKLLESLNLTLSKDSFKQELYSKQIDDSFINVIKYNLSDLITSDVVRDNKFEVKLDELNHVESGINIYINQLIKPEAELRQNELIELRQSLTDELYKIIGKNSNSFIFNLRAENYNIDSKTKNKIRMELINLISSESPIDTEFNYKLAELRYINEYGLENKVDDVLKRENEIYNVKIKEKRESLIDSMNTIIGKNTINLSFKQKLQSFNLDESFAKEIKNKIILLINSDEVNDDKFKTKLDELIDLENKGIETKIDEIIQNEIDRKDAILKEDLLKRLHDITGNTKLKESFIEKLHNALFEEEFGYKIKDYYESEIDSLKITEDFDFEIAIDDMISDEIKNELFNQIYDIIGSESNSEYYNNKLKESRITSKRGEEIRNELISLITDSDLDNLIQLKNRGMQDEFDKIISKEARLRQDRQMELRFKLLNELNAITNDNSFKLELKSKNLDESYADLIKNEIRDFIRLDDIVGDFEYKVDELEDVNQRGINNEIYFAIDKYAYEVKEKSEKIKNQLLDDLKVYSNQLSSKFSFNSYGIKSELKKRELSEEFGQKAINKLKNIISSKEIIDSRFNTKLGELEDIKEKTVKIKINEILDEYAEKQKYLITHLNAYLVTNEFHQKLKYKNLYPETSDNIRSDLEEKIKKGKITSSEEVDKAIQDYLNYEAVEIKKALETLNDLIGLNGHGFKFRAKLRINGLSSNVGKLIAQNVENQIRTQKLRANGVKNEIDKQIDMFVEKKKKKPLSISNNVPKYVFCEQCGHRNINGSNFCEQCGSRLSKLKGGK